MKARGKQRWQLLPTSPAQLQVSASHYEKSVHVCRLFPGKIASLLVFRQYVRPVMHGHRPVHGIHVSDPEEIRYDYVHEQLTFLHGMIEGTATDEVLTVWRTPLRGAALWHVEISIDSRSLPRQPCRAHLISCRFLQLHSAFDMNLVLNNDFLATSSHHWAKECCRSP